MPSRSTKRQILNDPFSAHEALDRTHLAATFFSEHVQTHQFVEAHPALRKAAEQIGDLLGDFYQQVGRARFAIDEPTTSRNKGAATAGRVAVYDFGDVPRQN
jgi:hypothetical protein